MTADRLRDSLTLRRLAALFLLALALWAAAPVLTGPIRAWREGREAVASESAILERLRRLEARRAAVAALAAKPQPPFPVVPDLPSAASAISARIASAAPAGAMRIDGLAPEVGEARPGSLVRVSFGFTATQGALQAFLAEIETRPPMLRVDRLVAAPIRRDDGTILLAGTGAVSAVPLLRGAP